METWPVSLQDFAATWTSSKASRQLLDFCDLIEYATRDIRIAPKRPDVVFADEAQDLNRMQLDLVRMWDEKAQYYVIAADDDQTIGASPQRFARAWKFLSMLRSPAERSRWKK